MKRSVSIACLAILLCQAQPARAWDPDEREYPVVDPPDAVEAKSTSEPTPVEPPDGIYLVTDVYAGDSVVHSGPLTTYTTDTVHEITGSYARVLESVASGAASAFDGTSFNQRVSLTDGRSVAGTYYENFVLTADGLVPVSVVFFQDDSELARSAPQPSTEPSSPSVTPAQPALAPAPVAAPIETPAAGEPPAYGYVTPQIDEHDRAEVSPVPLPGPSAVLTDRSIEVLRGRQISISFAGAGVRAWRVISTEGVALGPLNGLAGQPFRIRWDRLAPPSASWIARFAIDYADGATRELLVRVRVRAPGLIE